MRLDAFDYELPEELIAQHPAPERDAARLLAHDVGADRTRHGSVGDLARLLAPGDLLVVNDTRVLRARLHGRRASGGRVELLLLEPRASDRGEATWSALVNPARKLRPGERIELEDGALGARMLRRDTRPDGTPAMEWLVELTSATGSPVAASAAFALLERHGHMPLPPYVRRGTGADAPEDVERYQTVYAREPGAVAAPTAGLHFTPELLARLEDRGVRRAAVTLHVGHGTFQPVKATEIEEHRMHAERFELTQGTVDAVRETRERGGRVVAVGTTSVRVLESCLDASGELVAGSGETRLYLYPGRPVRAVDALLTNFHLPRSSLLLLVSAFAGRERILRLYAEAVCERYRFFSYGDAMFLYGVSGPSSS